MIFPCAVTGLSAYLLPVLLSIYTCLVPVITIVITISINFFIFIFIIIIIVISHYGFVLLVV